MKKTTFFKTLLVAVGLCAGSMNAWADNVHFGASTKDNTPWDDAYRSSTYTIAKGASAGLNFTIETNTSEETWQKYWNWILEVNCGAYWLDSRGDNLSGETWKHDDISVTTTYSDNFETAFTRDNMNGASVELVITRDYSNNVVVTSTSTKGNTTWWKKVTFTLPIDDDMTFKLTAEKSYGTIINKMSTVGSYNFNDNSAALPFSIYDTNRIGGSYKLYEEGGTDYYAEYKCTRASGIPFAYNNFGSSVSDAATVTFEFDYYIKKESCHALISIADANLHKASDGFSSNNNGYGVKGTIFNFGCWRVNSTTGNQFAVNSAYDTGLTESALEVWCHASITVDNINKKVSYTLSNKSTKDVIKSESNINFLNAQAQRCSQLDIFIGSNTNSYVDLDNLVITKTVSLTSHTYAVNAIAGDTKIKELLSGDAVEGSGFSTYIPEVISYNGAYYELDDASNGNLTNYFASYTMGTADVVKEINYTKNAAIAYYGDWETAYSTSSGNYGVQTNLLTLSQGQGRTVNRTGYTMDIAFTVPAGKYQIEIPYMNTNATARTHIIYLDGTEEANKLEEKSVGASGGFGTYSGEVDLTADEHRIYVKCTYNLTAAMDYLKVKAVSVPVTITDAGWATLYTPYALDFTGTGLTAYTASLEGSTVTLTEVTTVPANTGVVLKGDADTYSIPVIASSETAQGDLTGNASAATAYNAVTGKTLYVLALINNGQTVQFNPVTEGEIAAGKAYLPVTSGEAKLRVVFAGDASGIEEIATEAEDSDVLYNVAGQMVSKNYKGIVINKKGQKYFNK